MADLYIAFAGPGESSPRNTRSAIDKWIGDREVGGFYVPSSIDKREQPGLASVVGYLTDTWGPEDGEEDAFETVPAHALVDTLLEQDGDRYLVVIVGDAEVDPSRLGVLIDKARENGVTVLDLAAGLDEYTGGDASAEEAPPAPESEPERPKRRRRTTSTPEPEKPAEEPSAPRKPRGRPRTKEENEERAEQTFADLKEARTRAEERVSSGKVDEDGNELPFDGPTRPAAEIFPDAVDQALEETRADRINGENGLELIVTDSTEQFRSLLIVALQGALDALQGRTGKTEETFPYIVDDYGNILRRRGRGKPAKNEKTEFLTKSEAAARGYTEE